MSHFEETKVPSAAPSATTSPVTTPRGSAKPAAAMKASASTSDIQLSLIASGGVTGARTDTCSSPPPPVSVGVSAAPSLAPSHESSPISSSVAVTVAITPSSDESVPVSGSDDKLTALDAMFDAKTLDMKPRPIVIVRGASLDASAECDRDRMSAGARAAADANANANTSAGSGILLIKKLRTSGSGSIEDHKEVPSIDADARSPAQSPHPSAIPILSRQNSKQYDLNAGELKLSTQGFDPALMFSPRNQTQPPPPPPLSLGPSHHDKQQTTKADDSECRECAACTIM